MIYSFKDYSLVKAKWGRSVHTKTVRLTCEVVGSHGKDEVFIKLNKSAYFPKGVIIRVLKIAVTEK